MVDTGPGTQLPPQLIRYWTTGPGGAKIRWGVSGDFARCERLINEAVVKGGDAPLPKERVGGLCASLHRIATGAPPGRAPGEQRGGKHR